MPVPTKEARAPFEATIGAPVRVVGTDSWRYSFTQNLTVGIYTVEFVAGSWSDNGAVSNLAATQTFRVDQATAQLANGLGGRTIDRDLLNTAPTSFSASDIANLSLFASRMTSPTTALDTYLASRLAGPTLAALTTYLATPGSSPTAALTALVADLNAILSGASIYDATRFTGIALRAETEQLRQTNPSGAGLVRLNRLLLEDAYPTALAKSAGRYIDVTFTPVFGRVLDLSSINGDEFTVLLPEDY